MRAGRGSTSTGGRSSQSCDGFVAGLEQNPQPDRNRPGSHVFDFHGPQRARTFSQKRPRSLKVNSLIYLVGLIVIVLAILSFLGLS